MIKTTKNQIRQRLKETVNISKNNIQGEVVRINLKEKTARVRVYRTVVQKFTQKRFTLHKNYIVDTLGEFYGLGDIVSLQEVRPMSKRKHKVINSLIRRANND